MRHRRNFLLNNLLKLNLKYLSKKKEGEDIKNTNEKVDTIIEYKSNLKNCFVIITFNDKKIYKFTNLH